MSNLSVATYREWSGNTTAPSTALVQAAIDAAEAAINDHCARYFAVAHASTATARLYTPDAGSVLRIHDCVAVTAITDDGTTLTSTQYQLEPVNNLAASGLAVPYDQIRRLDGYTWSRDYGRATVSVTARWGWSALPAQYTEATKILVGDIINQASIKNGVVGFGEFGAVRVRENPMVTALLSSLVRVEAWGIA
jgi:hypothetical protein